MQWARCRCAATAPHKRWSSNCGGGDRRDRVQPAVRPGRGADRPRPAAGGRPGRVGGLRQRRCVHAARRRPGDRDRDRHERATRCGWLPPTSDVNRLLAALGVLEPVPPFRTVDAASRNDPGDRLAPLKEADWLWRAQARRAPSAGPLRVVASTSTTLATARSLPSSRLLPDDAPPAGDDSRRCASRLAVCGRSPATRRSSGQPGSRTRTLVLVPGC